jgi:hypothetical protein
MKAIAGWNREGEPSVYSIAWSFPVRIRRLTPVSPIPHHYFSFFLSLIAIMVKPTMLQTLPISV